MIYFPFDNTSAVVLDRNVSSDVYASYMAMFFRNGVHPVDSTYFQVYSTETPDSMTLQVKPGLAVINGRFAREDVERTLIVQASDTQDRIDLVVLRLDLSQRLVDLYVVKGTAGASPIAPTQTRSGDIYELVLAQVFINANSTTISNIKITDTRLNSDLCGTISFAGATVDTTSIFNQYQASLNEFLGIVASAIDETMYGDLVAMIEGVAFSLTGTLPNTSWTGSSAPYTKVVSVPGILATDEPIIDIVPSGTYATDLVMRDDWANIGDIVASNDNLTFYADAIPSASIPFIVKVVR